MIAAFSDGGVRVMTGGSEALGEKIRAARKQLKMTQAELAGPDFTKSFISQVEKGFARPSLKSLQILASRLNKPVSYFLEDEPPQEPAAPSAKMEQLLQSGRALAEDGHLQEALAIFEEILSSVPKGEHTLRSQALIEMSAVLWQLDRKLEAVNTLEEGLDLHRLFHDPLGRVEALERLAAYAAELEDLSRAAALCEQALTVLEDHHLQRPSLELKLRTNAGLYWARLQQFSRAERHLKAAMKLAQDTDDYYKWGEICHAMGFILGALDDLEGAIQYSMRAVRFYEAVGNRERQVLARLNAAGFLHQAGRRSEAEEELNLALAEAEAEGYTVGIAHVYQVRGELAEKDEDWEKAAEAYSKALEHQRRPDTQALLLRSLARALQRLNRTPEALEHQRRAVAMLEKRKASKKQELAQAYSELAFLLKETGAWEEAQEVFNRSLELSMAQNPSS